MYKQRKIAMVFTYVITVSPNHRGFLPLIDDNVMVSVKDVDSESGVRAVFFATFNNATDNLLNLVSVESGSQHRCYCQKIGSQLEIVLYPPNASARLEVSMIPLNGLAHHILEQDRRLEKLERQIEEFRELLDRPLMPGCMDSMRACGVSVEEQSVRSSIEIGQT